MAIAAAGRLSDLLSRRGSPVCVVAPATAFSMASVVLAEQVRPTEILCVQGHPHSAWRPRLGWAVQDCALVTLHGRALERILPELHPHRRLLVLSWDGTTPERLAALLTAHGFGGARLTVCEALGGPRERVRMSQADGFALSDIQALNLVAIEIDAAPGARAIPLTPGLPDAWFEHDGQMTKSDVRAVTLAALAPRVGEMLWDIGAGSGSVGIEWMLRHPRNRAIAIEREPLRAARIARNAASLGVPDLSIIQGEAPKALAELPQPDAIFVGGGAGTGVIDAAWEALSPNGRLVANGVTIETQAELIRRYKSLGGALKTIQIAHADPVGGFHGMRPAMTVTQWSAAKK